MRPRELLFKIRAEMVKYVQRHTGPNRKKRREELKMSRLERKKGPARARPKNWNRDKHRRRAEQKRRRKQSWKA